MNDLTELSGVKILTPLSRKEKIAAESEDAGTFVSIVRSSDVIWE